MQRGLYLAKGKQYKAGKGKDIDLILYWTTLLVLIVANFFMAVALIPFLLLSTSFHFYLITAMLALFFGYVFNLLVENTGKIDRYHHLLAVLFVPTSAIVNLIVISTSTVAVAKAIGIESNQNPLFVSVFYVVFFMLPYFFAMIRKH